MRRVALARLERLAGLYRAQLLVEAPRRADLQAFLSDWLPAVAMLARARRPQVRWQIEVDPQQI